MRSNTLPSAPPRISDSPIAVGRSSRAAFRRIHAHQHQRRERQPDQEKRPPGVRIGEHAERRASILRVDNIEKAGDHGVGVEHGHAILNDPFGKPVEGEYHRSQSVMA